MEHSDPRRHELMEAVVERKNITAAWKQVRANKGAPGMDGMTVYTLLPYLRQHWPRIKEELLSGHYVPPTGAWCGLPETIIGGYPR